MAEWLDIWTAQDGIRTVVQAVCGTDCVRRLHYDEAGQCFALELTEHLSEERANDLASQFYLPASYDGEGSHGSLFTLAIK